MPGSEPPRRPDLAEIPAFLRAARAAAEGSKPARTEPSSASANLAIPRPATPPAPSEPPSRPRLDPASLPMPSLSRRRLVTAAGVLVASLLALSFARQVGEAGAAGDRATELRGANVALRDAVEGLQRDLGHVQDPRFILLQARAYGMGARHEIPFALAAGAPELPADAPGSAAVRLGAEPASTSPLEAWLEVLFGPGA